jgi:geranylgeranyl diphosphate synthase type II
MTSPDPALLERWHAALDVRLEARLPLSTLAGAGRLNDAVRYAVFPGGRRWRPAITLLGAAVAGVDAARVLDVACGVELVHSASLVLDDLPSMDDGRQRRGRPTVHVAFGEAIALLAALTLLNRGYELFLSPVAGAPAEGGARVLRAATRAIGSDGMIGGQALDLGQPAGASLASRDRKTTTLVALAASAGAMAAGAAEEDVAALTRYGDHLGAAYQMHDDLLDEAPEMVAVKTVGQDARHGRASWAASASAGSVRGAAAAAVAQARSAIRDRFGERPEALLLIQIADAILDVKLASSPAQDFR